MNQGFNFEQMDGAMALPIIIGGVIGLAIGLAIAITIIILISGCFKRIPQQYRLMEPGMVWLLLIPCVNLVWIFFVWLRLARSYQAYFESVGVTDVGDCGYGLNLAYCIAVVASIPLSLIPCVGILFALAPLVLLIICLVKAIGLKNRIEMT